MIEFDVLKFNINQNENLNKFLILNSIDYRNNNKQFLDLKELRVVVEDNLSDLKLLLKNNQVDYFICKFKNKFTIGDRYDCLCSLYKEVKESNNLNQDFLDFVVTVIYTNYMNTVSFYDFVSDKIHTETFKFEDEYKMKELRYYLSLRIGYSLLNKFDLVEDKDYKLFNLSEKCKLGYDSMYIIKNILSKLYF